MLALLGVLTDKVRCSRMEGQLRWQLGRLLQSKYQPNVMDVVDGQSLPNRLCASLCSKVPAGCIFGTAERCSDARAVSRKGKQRPLLFQ